jgi:hypothetical protein
VVNTNIDNGVGNHGGSAVLAGRPGGVEYRAWNRPACSPNIAIRMPMMNADGLTGINTSITSFGVSGTCRR